MCSIYCVVDKFEYLLEKTHLDNNLMQMSVLFVSELIRSKCSTWINV